MPHRNVFNRADGRRRGKKVFFRINFSLNGRSKVGLVVVGGGGLLGGRGGGGGFVGGGGTFTLISLENKTSQPITSIFIS